MIIGKELVLVQATYDPKAYIDQALGRLDSHPLLDNPSVRLTSANYLDYVKKYPSNFS